MITKLQRPTLIASLRMGGFIGWTLAVMCICQQNLRYYQDDNLLQHVNTTFLTTGAITGAVLVVVLLLLDLNGLLGDRLLKWLPGVIMAEAGIALALTNAGTMTSFAAIAGVAASLGAMAVFTHLLHIKVGQRMAAVGLGLAIGGAIRMVTAAVIAHASRTGLVITAAAVGIFAILTVHTRGDADRSDGILVARAEASPRTIISKVPYVYIILPVLAGAFWLAHTHIQGHAEAKLPAGYEGYELAAYVGFVLAALVAALFVRMSRLALLFAVSTGIAAAAGMMAALPYLTDNEAGLFAIMSFASLACTRACIYLFILVFSLDRPHPLFYSMFGYTVAVIAELGGVWLDRHITGLHLRHYIAILLVLMPLGGALLSMGMRKYGFSQEKLDHRKVTHNLIRRRSAELELSEREQTMLESIVLEGNGVEELAGRMLFSHNTVKVLLRPIYRKLNASSPEELREQFDRATYSEEEFLARVHAAEEEKRAADRQQAREERREQREKERRERERLDQEELERKLLEMQTMNQIMGTEPEESGETDNAESDTASEAVNTDSAAVPEGDSVAGSEEENSESSDSVSGDDPSAAPAAEDQSGDEADSGDSEPDEPDSEDSDEDDSDEDDSDEDDSDGEGSETTEDSPADKD